MIENTRLAEAQQILHNYIKLKGLRNTPERQKILEIVYSVNTPFTVDMVWEYLQDEYRVTRVTVYNSLELFFKAGLVIKRSNGNEGMEYEACVQTQTHHNMCCTICNQLFEFKDPSIAAFLGLKRYKKFKMTNCSVMIYGICAKCQAKINREKRKQKNKQK
ncbi:MAG: transcriptional repressor [Bacteroidaceae bacterium]|nr:transcriptional repressor [Bacteroidaceae bacterium]